MATFPLRKRPVASYKASPRSFGSSRAGGNRKHAGCDLYAQAGDEVLAVEDGVVVRGPYLFYDGVYAIEVQHASGLIRYGEISKAANGLQPGSTVKEGQVIGFVGKMQTVPQSMLHLEMFSGHHTGQLTDREQKPYMRRADLINPTEFLDGCICQANSTI